MHKADWVRYDDGQCELGLWMRKDFQFIKAAASGIEGMLSVFSMALLDCVLSFQEEHRITGNIVELGVFRGQSAAILAGHIEAPERLVLVDPVGIKIELNGLIQ